MNPFALIGHVVLRFFRETGRLTLFTLNSLLACVTPTFYFRQLGQQLMRIGFYSLPVVGLTAFFTGGALALQIYIGGSRAGAEMVVPQIVVLGITRELGPVIAALMLAGRVSAAIAAEIGTMRVTEQIDALSTLSTNPYKFLIAPRLLAALIATPLLVAIADVLGVFGGWTVAVTALDFNSAIYLKNTVSALYWDDITSGLWKAAAFGFIISLMGAYNGFHSKGGAQGVGAATTNAVVAAAILILAANFVMTNLFFSR
jgi:phospholipid/cholesterol/gamma-HCH transport system permease protein